MKTITTTILLFTTAFLITKRSSAQDELPQVIPQTVFGLENFRDSDKKFQNYTLNALFMDLLNGTTFSSSDLSTRRYYAALTNEDNEFSLGFNFNYMKSPVYKKNWIFSIGVAAKSKSGFATIYKNDKLQNELFVNLKISRIGNGIITFSDNDELRYKNYYNNYLRSKYEGKLKKKILEDLVDAKNKKSALGATEAELKAMESQLMKPLTNSVLEELAKEEVELLEKERLYSRIWDWTWSAEAKLPVSPTEFKTAISADSVNYRKETQYLADVSLRATSIWKFRNHTRVYLTPRVTFSYTNNAVIDELNTADFLSFVNQGAANYAVTETNKVFIGEFEPMVIGKFGLEGIYFPRNSWVGVSASIEQWGIGRSVTNWKLGLPITVKDKEGSAVNFELQWKEVNKSHFVGIRVGFVLGKFVS